MREIFGKEVYFYVVEGVDKAGKTIFISNLIRTLERYFQGSDVEVYGTEEPITGRRHTIIDLRRKHGFGDREVLKQEYRLFMEDRKQHISWILQHIHTVDEYQRIVVVTDRYDYSTIAYQLYWINSWKYWLDFKLRSWLFIDPDWYYILVPRNTEEYLEYMARYRVMRDETDPRPNQITRIIKVYSNPCKWLNKKYLRRKPLCPVSFIKPFPDDQTVEKVAREIFETVMF